jgi:serpin B
MIKLFKSSLIRVGTLNLFLAATSVASAQPAATDVVVTANTRFAFDLYARLKTTDGNLFFSPYSISTCLAMTWAGARGDTESQMAGVLHFSTVQTGLHSQFASLQNQLNAVQEKKKVALNIANGLWAQQDHSFLPEFLKIATRDYAAKVEQVDFHTGAESTRKDINDWVSGKTADRIQNLIPPGALDSMTRLVLVNAIYFKGQWATQFKAGNTRPAPFKLAPGRTASAQFMNLTDNFRYAEADGLQLLELPYTGGDLSMVVLLPAETNSFKDFENSLSAEKLDQWLGQARSEKVDVFLPKFKLTQQFALADTLAAMGMTDAFSPSADFSGMDGAHDLYISAVIHKAFVEVNEEGTEAAAATGVTVRAMALARPMPEYVFRADHPFVFLIREVHSGSVLFLGRITEPGP